MGGVNVDGRLAHPDPARAHGTSADAREASLFSKPKTLVHAEQDAIGSGRKTYQPRDEDEVGERLSPSVLDVGVEFAERQHVELGQASHHADLVVRSFPVLPA
jgi:hypothetical protein